MNHSGWSPAASLGPPRGPSRRGTGRRRCGRAQLNSPSAPPLGALRCLPAGSPRSTALRGDGSGAGSQTLRRKPFRWGIGENDGLLSLLRLGSDGKVANLAKSPWVCVALMNGWCLVLEIAQLVFMFPSDRKCLSPGNISPALSGSGLGFTFPPNKSIKALFSFVLGQMH